jgi:hypothetical protein
MKFFAVALALISGLAACSANAPYLLGPQLPDGAVANIPAPGILPPDIQALAGKWEGRLIGPLQVDTVLVIEHLGTSTAAVIYSTGDTNYSRGFWSRAAANVKPGVIQFTLPSGAEAEYLLQTDATLKATINVKGTRWSGTMKRIGI